MCHEKETSLELQNTLPFSGEQINEMIRGRKRCERFLLVNHTMNSSRVKGCSPIRLATH